MLIWSVDFGFLRHVGLVTQTSVEAPAAMLGSDHMRAVETHSCLANLPDKKTQNKILKGSMWLRLSRSFPSPTPGHSMLARVIAKGCFPKSLSGLWLLLEGRSPVTMRTFGGRIWVTP